MLSSGRRNSLRALAVVIRANSASERPRISASRAAVKATRAGSLVCPRQGGAEIGAVGFDQGAGRAERGRPLAQRVESLVRERHHSGEREVQAQFQERLGIVPGSGERSA